MGDQGDWADVHGYWDGFSDLGVDLTSPESVDGAFNGPSAEVVAKEAPPT